MGRHRFPAWLFVGLACVWAGTMLAEAYVLYTSTPFTPAGAHRVVSSLSRSHNVLVSVILVSVALAIPITASHYTPKLLRIFLADRIHIAVLTTYALAAVHANTVLFLTRHGHVSEWLVLTVVLTMGVGFVMVVPYFFYVIWFLEPTTLIRRIRQLGVHALSMPRGSPKQLEEAREVLSNSIQNLGSLVLKLVDGLARQSAASGVLALRQLLAEYGRVKDQMPVEWFAATRSEFRGLSRDALQFISADRCWVEIVALHDLTRVFDASLKRMPDAVVSIADTLRGIGVDALRRDDARVFENVLRCFNALIRSAITHRKPHAVFDVNTQYQALAEECMTQWPHQSVDVARYMRSYSALARQSGLVFIPELFLYDAGALLTTAVDADSAAVPGILSEVLSLTRKLSESPTVPGACAALVTYGSVVDTLAAEQAEAFAEQIEELPDAILVAGFQVLDATVTPRYHELTARQVDLNFLPPQQVEILRARFVDRTPAARPEQAAN